ncbi:hypothetical protein [Actinacidiphila alni]
MTTLPPEEDALRDLLVRPAAWLDLIKRLTSRRPATARNAPPKPPGRASA